MSRTGRNWARTELPQLVEKGIVPDDVAQRIREYYAEDESANRMPLALAICGVLGAVFIGLGVILMFAHNWEGLSRSVRAVLAFLPLIVGQGLVAFTLLRKSNSIAWIEGSGTFLALMIGACIALVSQTYQIPGDIGGFLLAWALLGLPIIYLVDSRIAAALYVIAITTWAGYHQGRGESAIGHWFLLALIAPYVYNVCRAEPSGARVSALSWTIAICLCFSVGFVMEDTIEELWPITFASLFSAMFLFGHDSRQDGLLGWRKAYFVVGGIGAGVLLLILTYERPWDQFGHSGYRLVDGPFWSVVNDFVVLAVLFVAALSLLTRSILARKKEDVLLGLFPVVTALACGVAALAEFELPAVVLVNVYMFGLGVGISALGLRNMRLGLVNMGLMILGAWIVARFFDLDVGFFVRGLMFIVLGISFLSVNFILVRRQQKEVTT